MSRPKRSAQFLQDGGILYEIPLGPEWRGARAKIPAVSRLSDSFAGVAADAASTPSYENAHSLRLTRERMRRSRFGLSGGYGIFKFILMKLLEVLLNPRHDLSNSGFFLSAAVSAGARIRIDAAVDPLVPQFEAEGKRCAVDLFDSSRRYDKKALAHCDLYFKRGYIRADVPGGYQEKVFPFGLNYICRTRGSLVKVLSAFGRCLRMPGNSKNYLAAGMPGTFEFPAAEAYEAKVLFQTRIWPLEQLGEMDAPEQINSYRIGMLKELKRTFGNRFVGGLMPTVEAASYPELITKMPTFRWQYAAWSRPAAIGIYTRGLHNSNAFKVAEYLASSKCIVGERLYQDLTQPLGECHSVRETIEDTIAECETLLSNPKKLENIRRASWNYYQSQVRYDLRLDLLFSRI